MLGLAGYAAGLVTVCEMLAEKERLRVSDAIRRRYDKPRLVWRDGEWSAHGKGCYGSGKTLFAAYMNWQRAQGMLAFEQDASGVRMRFAR